jgi:hypothetical protein
VKVYVVVNKLFGAGDHVPEMPSFEGTGSVKVAPEQIGAIAVKVVVIVGLTVIVKVAVVPQEPTFGVNVYVVVAVLFSAGDHVPTIPFGEVVGNAAKVAPEQMGAIGLKVVVTFELTVIVIVAMFAQSPGVGVNVYVVVAVLFNAGNHVPVTPFKEVVGSGLNVAPEQIAATGVKVGVKTGLTVIVIVAVFAHCPALGVNV